MTQLFKRSASLTINEREVSSLRYVFDVFKSLKREPNTAEISVFNLSENTRKTIEASPFSSVRLRAGYEGAESLIYFGDLRQAYTIQDRTETVTIVTSGDGEDAIAKSRINESFGPLTPLPIVFAAIAGSLGLPPGNSIAVAAQLQAEGKAALFPRGVVLSGQTAKELDDLTESVGITWSVQDGSLQFVRENQPIPGTALLLSPATGLIGTPTVDNKGRVSCTTLLIPDVRPGKLFTVASKQVQGLFRFESVRYSGDTHGDAWIIDVEGSPVLAP